MCIRDRVTPYITEEETAPSKLFESAGCNVNQEAISVMETSKNSFHEIPELCSNVTNC